MLVLLKNLWLFVIEVFKTIFNINTVLGHSLLKIIGIGAVTGGSLVLIIIKFVYPKIKRWIDEG